jgi:hypothetical protein
MKYEFKTVNFRADSLAQIELVNAILDEYRAQGFSLSLRQLYYQLVARGHIPNSLRSYKNLGNLVSDARLSGLVDWDMIVDRNREVIYPSHWDSPEEIIKSAAASFRLDKWVGQENHVEVMVEKQALEGVLAPVCEDLDIRFTANKGYSSQSAMYEAGRRLAYMSRREHKQCYILYLGDHDPSGLDMDRDVLERLEMFSRLSIEVQRLALTWDQIEEYSPPENPAKTTDSRAEAYILEFGESSWELDALEPAVLADLVRGKVLELRDNDLWQERVDEEEEMRAKLLALAAKGL